MVFWLLMIIINIYYNNGNKDKLYIYNDNQTG